MILKLISACHSLFSIIFYGVNNIYGLSDSIMRIIFYISFMYFMFDTVVEVINKDPVYILHHIACLIIIYMILPYAEYYEIIGRGFFLAEINSLLINISSMINSRNNINNYIMLINFLIYIPLRVIYAPILIHEISYHVTHMVTMYTVCSTLLLLWIGSILWIIPQCIELMTYLIFFVLIKFHKSDTD